LSCVPRAAARSSSSPPTRRCCSRSSGARIYELTASGVAETAYDDLDAVRFTRGFLQAPERYLRAALGDE
jgi:hypothetical protein